ncbi:MAG: DUF1810 family protein [Legionella sp.]|nr:DUF1810 family protein [Legionella sp.]
MPLTHFIQAQQGQSGHPSFDYALNELYAGKKNGHWIWYVFPQLRSLGRSATAKKYGVLDLDEALTYLQDNSLFKNYQSIVTATNQQLNSKSLNDLVGWDDVKVISSVTLFREAAESLSRKKGVDQDKFKALKLSCDTFFIRLAKHADKGFAPSFYLDKFTLEKLGKEKTFAPFNKSSELIKSTDNPQLFFKQNDSEKLIKALDEYIDKRNQEWNFHYNFLGVMALIYRIKDLLYGTDHFNAKSRETKIAAANKSKDYLNSDKSEPISLTDADREALSNGRLGTIMEQNGGLSILVNQHYDNSNNCKK